MREGRPVVLLTGANGFVGRNLVPVLIARGMVVKQAVRQPSTKSDVIVVNGIGPHTDWEEALREVDAVVHLAARVHHPREENASELYHSINRDGTLHLARCAASVGVRHFVYLSTVLVNGSSTDGRKPFSESDHPMPRGVYGLSKAAAEKGLEAIARESDMDITIIRPPMIYGPGALGNFRLLVKAVEAGIPLPFGSIQNRRAFLNVGNLASFVVHVLAHDRGKFNIFLLADAEEISTPDFIRSIAKASGTRARLLPFSQIALRALFTLSGRSEAINSILGSMQIYTSKARETGWRPTITLEEGLRSSLSANKPPKL